MKKESIHAEIKLTDAELLACGKEMGEANAGLRAAQDRLKMAMTQIKSEIAEIEARINTLANKLNTGREMRLVECKVDVDLKKRVVRYVSLATGEIIKERPVNDQDTQLELEA